MVSRMRTFRHNNDGVHGIYQGQGGPAQTLQCSNPLYPFTKHSGRCLDIYIRFSMRGVPPLYFETSGDEELPQVQTVLRLIFLENIGRPAFRWPYSMRGEGQKSSYRSSLIPQASL